MSVQSNHDLEVAEWTAFWFALLSLLCSLLTLLLVRLMRAWNGYLLLITSLTVCQLMYDVNYLLGVVPTFAACAAWNFLDVLGGLSVTLWSNFISFVVMFVVRRIRSFNIFRNYKYFFVVAVGPPLTLAVLGMSVVTHASQDDDRPNSYCVYDNSTLSVVITDVYYWGRLASILFNFGVFGYTSFRVRQMTYMKPAASKPGKAFRSSSSSTASENQTMAVFSLVSRMKYYPLAQALCRSGAAWNEYDNYKYSSFASNMMASVCSPSTGTMYFLIFLIMQPRAFYTLKCLLTGNLSLLQEQPSPHGNLFAKEDLNNFNEEDLEIIIDDYEGKSRVASVDTSRTTSTFLHFQNPLRRSDEGL